MSTREESSKKTAKNAKKRRFRRRSELETEKPSKAKTIDADNGFSLQSSLTLLDNDEKFELGHKLDDMLVGCLINRKKCSTE